MKKIKVSRLLLFIFIILIVSYIIAYKFLSPLHPFQKLRVFLMLTYLIVPLIESYYLKHHEVSESVRRLLVAHMRISIIGYIYAVATFFYIPESLEYLAGK